jgi:MFS transporter, putative metabolite:H+ symporter
MLLWTSCFVAIGLASSSTVIYVSVFLLSGSLGFYVPLMYTLTAESFPTRARATGVSLTDGAGHLGGAVGPVLALSVYAWGGVGSGFTTVFLFMAVSGLLTALLLPFTVKATRRSLEVVSIETESSQTEVASEIRTAQ